MLADPKSAALVDNFAGQWLRTRALADLDPDYERYGDFDEQLRESMRAETEIYFQTFLDGDLDLRDLLDSGFSHIDARLAIHYGMEVPGGGGFGRVELAGTHRNGLLTQAAILSVTSHRTRTSPVRRGLWVLENLLCLEPPPPPPNVPPLSEPVDPEASLRDRMEQHRSDPACAGCHALMDPLGFGLEHFDAIGAWRDDDDGFPIDSAGQLPDGRAFEDATELGEVLRDDPDFARCVIEQVFTYGLGRGPVAADACALDGLGKDLERRDHRLGGLVRALVESDSFTKRRGEPGSEGAE